MAQDELRAVDRRTVLKTMTATAAAAIGATGTTAAIDDGVLEVGDRVVIDAPYRIVPDEEACNGDDDYDLVYEPGDEGCLIDYQECFSDTSKFLFEPINGGRAVRGWLAPSYLEETGLECFGVG